MRRAEAGFSLLEMLVALAVFSLAVLALLHLSGQNARSAVIVEEQVLAGIVADTIAAESLLLDAAALANAPEGSEVAGDREWRWRRSIAWRRASREKNSATRLNQNAMRRKLGMDRRDSIVSTGWCVGPSSPNPILS